MNKRLRPLFLCVLAWITLTSTADAADPIFPKVIQFKVRTGSLLTGSFDLSFGDDLNAEDGDRYLITLKNFEGLGFSSDQELWSMIFKKDLALYGHVVVADAESGEVIRQVFLDTDCTSAIGQEKTSCFKYQEKATGAAIQTEIFTPYLAIDLVSSIVVATHEASRPDFTETHFNFIFNKTTKQVTLVQAGTEEIETPTGKQAATVLTLKLKDTDFELYRFYIARAQQGHYPAKMLFVDETKGENLEFVADEVIWP